MTKKEKYLRRYTDVSALLYLLREQKITLLDPQSWDDRNDSYYLDLYKNKRELKSLLALCFTKASERYHFWRVFAGAGSSGVRVKFKRQDLLGAVAKQPDLRWKSVEYKKLQEIEETHIQASEFPFVKRNAFRDEEEFRMIYESKTQQISKLDIPIPLTCIQDIKLNPWLHPDLFSHVEKVLHSIKDSGSVRILRSGLIHSQRWKSAGEKAISAAK